ncbi:MAG: hypothetical protein IJX69_06585 [Oscillospiraceae bacterium]|nr:hypothetical protein [Oscillospiraceae bacterium]
MEFVIMLLVVVVTFGGCFLFDKGFEKIFRNKAQHHSGLTVRLNKRYIAFGFIMIALGVASILAGLNDTAILIAGGILILVVGAALVVYYTTFGVFYDDDSFLLTTFGKKSTIYPYQEIKGQRLYIVQGGNVVVELHMSDGRSVSLQSTMIGVYPFLDHAFAAWCRQTGRDSESCDFHDPENHLWFPTMEDK